eukprot:TRINITY_DN15412_c0_g1_i1.p1 TRINITY_DN15412_c0_g1~~TRINITY_DN15412_c0_g1_i1.p1  ORF type:complete len:279 (+),score=44.91 TRINITY_DN15412_c0_g1_i1:104-940(+)
MPVVEDQISQSSSDDGYYYRKSKPFVKNPSKIFVGGLPYSTSDEELNRVFSRFGEISEVVVMKDSLTKRSRGFGFVTFADAVAVDLVLDEHEREPIVLNRKKIDPKRAIPKKITARRTKKVFVGGISSDTSQDDVYNYFKDFGNIVEAMLIFDKSTNKHKGFGFVTYDKYDTVDEICCQQFHVINGKKVETKRAQPKDGTVQRTKKQEGECYLEYSSENASKYPYMGYYPQEPYYSIYSPYYGRYVHYFPYFPTGSPDQVYMMCALSDEEPNYWPSAY